MAAKLIVFSCLVYGIVAESLLGSFPGQGSHYGGRPIVVGSVHEQSGRVISPVGPHAGIPIYAHQPGRHVVLNGNGQQVVVNQSGHLVAVPSGQPVAHGHATCNAIHCPIATQNIWATDGRQCFQFNGHCNLNKENCRRRSINQLLLQPTTRRLCQQQKSHRVEAVGPY